MAIIPKRSRGRPPKALTDRKRHTLAVRARDALRGALEVAAERNQRSLSEEAELRLEQSLTDQERLFEGLDWIFGRQLTGLLIALGCAMRDTGVQAGFAMTHTLQGTHSWMDNSFAFAQAVIAAQNVMEVMRPPGDAEGPKFTGGPPGLDLTAAYADLGGGFAAAITEAIVGHSGTVDLEHWGSAIRVRLGPEILKRLERQSAHAENEKTQKKTR